MFEFIKAVSDTVLDMINAAYQDKPSSFIGAMFREKLISHHWAVNEADSCLLMQSLGSMPLTKESHFIGLVQTMKLSK